MIISIYRSIYSCIESKRIVEFFEVSANIVSLGMRIDIVSNRDETSDLHPYLLAMKIYIRWTPRVLSTVPQVHLITVHDTTKTLPVCCTCTLHIKYNV